MHVSSIIAQDGGNVLKPLRNLNCIRRFIVHHKVSLTPQNINNFDIAYGWDNLMLLCLECHNKIHSKDNNTRTMHFDEDGNLVAVDEPVRVDE